MLSGIMIVLDEEECVARALDSFVAYMDEVIVVDGGSKDRTKEIVSSYEKVQLYERAWTDDYSEQRNFALEKTKGDWIFYLDADEYILPYVGRNLKRLMELDFDAVAFIYKNFVDGWMTNLFDENWHVKLFRNYCRFAGKYHESPNGYKSMRRCNLEIYHDKTLQQQRLDDMHYWDLGQIPPEGWVKEDGKWVYKPSG